VPLAGACSLLLAAHRGRRLVYIGRVEWGATRAIVARIREGVHDSIGVVWIHPDVVAEVVYSELMQGRLRDLVLRRVL
jgi:ATP-dependent DNA ligase